MVFYSNDTRASNCHFGCVNLHRMKYHLERIYCILSCEFDRHIHIGMWTSCDFYRYISMLSHPVSSTDTCTSACEHLATLTDTSTCYLILWVLQTQMHATILWFPCGKRRFREIARPDWLGRPFYEPDILLRMSTSPFRTLCDFDIHISTTDTSECEHQPIILWVRLTRQLHHHVELPKCKFFNTGWNKTLLRRAHYDRNTRAGMHAL